MKWHMKTRKFSPVIRPDGFAVLTLPDGPSLIKWSWNILRGNVNMGGIALPTAEIAPSMAMSVTRSAKVIFPTCLLPFLTMTLLGF